MKTNPRSGNAAFTLIELMAVITIIGILASLVVVGMGFANERQAKEKARVQIALLSKALEEYKLDMGTYPLSGNSVTGAGNTSSLLYQPLFQEGYQYTTTNPTGEWVKPVGSNTKFPKSTRIYLAQLDPTSSKQGWVATATTVPTALAAPGVSDPWGKEYSYRSATPPPSSNTSAPTVNTNTINPDFDLWSWGKDGLSVPATPANPGNRDDIRNF